MANNDAAAKVRFLVDIARRFEVEGNFTEAAKSDETALLLRKSMGPAAEPGAPATAFPTSLDKQAQALVLMCNSRAVEHFQRDDFDVALFLLNKALFLTEDAPETNCFGSHVHDRLRLRAATFNNLGCLEKRRGRLPEALASLHKAAELETLVDSDIGPSPSTNMNLCTVLNKMSKHVQAAAAAERAVVTLKAESRQGQEHVPQFASMLVMAHYNYGVSLEFAGRPGDISMAREAYTTALDVAKRYLERPHDNPTVVAAERALQRVTGVPQSSLPLIAARSAPPATLGAAAGATRSPSQLRPFGDSPMSSVYTPQPPQNGPRAPLANRAFAATASASSLSGVGGLGKQGDAVSKHAERIQARQRKKEEMKERDDRALKRAQQAHVREKHEKLRRERELEAQRRDEMARAMYDKMINGLRAAEIRTMKQAARTIQKHWRGYMVREFIRTMQRAVVKMQAVVRSWLCRHHLRIEREKARQRAIADAERRRKAEAARVIQRRARIFIHRIHLVRDFKVRQMRRQMSAKRIQRFYRNYRQKLEQRILDRIERERREDAQRTERLHNAACRIQGMYRAFKSRRFMRVVKLEQQRRGEAATKIQAQMRGALTRQWFRHYRMYRRQQELSTAQNMKQIVKIQRAWRMAVAKRVVRRKRLEKHLADRTQLLFISARRIQCAWRSYRARCVAGERLAHMRRRHAAATKIQGRWRVYLCRKVYIWRRDEHRKMKALRRIQEWWKLLLLKWKHQELARYHSARRKEELIATIRTSAAIALQQCGRAILSSQITATLARDYARRSLSVMRLQSAGRHFLVQREMRTLKRVAYLVDQQHKRSVLFNKAALTIQCPVRVMLAKNKVAYLRRQRVAAVIIQKTVRMHFAKCEYRRRAKAKRDRIEDAAARKIQRSVRLFLKRLELKRLDAYYTERRRQKLLQMRREEAAIAIQALWRGYATRQVTTAQRSRLLQNTIDAIRIQRAWRTHLFRQSIGKEIASRVAKKMLVVRSAIKIQCFWRRVLAQEYVAYVREKRFLQTVACIQIQCCFRRFRARRELQIRKVARRQGQLMQARRHDQWSMATDLVNACLRSIVARRRRLVLLEQSLLSALEQRDRREFRRRYDAATSIQAAYRGHYERVYARGLRREKEERDRVARELALKQHNAACCIQRGWRCAVARDTVNKKRVEKRVLAAEELMRAERTANPKDLIKQLFWSHEAVLNKDIAKGRAERNAAMEAAAIKMQKTARMFIQVRRYRRRREAAKQNAAAAAIQEQFRLHEARVAQQKAAQRNAAATKIQAVARMFIARIAWTQEQQRLRVARHAQTTLDERRDGAATAIQATWRRVLAVRRADGIREQRFREKAAQVEFEAARMIQKHVRGLLARRRVDGMMRQQRRRPSAGAVIPPRPPQGGSGGGSGGGGGGGGSSGGAPPPAPRRRISNPPYPNVK